jgi:DNA-binding CsgD family transcriptional regulator
MSKKNKNNGAAASVSNELAAAEKRVAELKQAAKDAAEAGVNALKADSAELIAKYGFNSASEFHSAFGRVNDLFAKRGGKSKLSVEQKAEMVETLKNPQGKTTKEIAKLFGVSTATVSIAKRDAGLVKARATA